MYKNAPRRKGILMVAGTIVAACLFFSALEFTGITHVFHKTPSPGYVNTPSQGSASANSQKGEPQEAKVTDNTTGPKSAQPGDTKSDNGGTSSTITLLSPTGDFISAHGDSTNPISSDTQLASVCNTSPGAICIITFSSGGIKKSLHAEIADRGGSAYWNSWTPRSIQLTAGSWLVQATASLNGQTKTSNDARFLVVSS